MDSSRDERCKLQLIALLDVLSLFFGLLGFFLNCISLHVALAHRFCLWFLNCIHALMYFIGFSSLMTVRNWVMSTNHQFVTEWMNEWMRYVVIIMQWFSIYDFGWHIRCVSMLMWRNAMLCVYVKWNNVSALYASLHH